MSFTSIEGAKRRIPKFALPGESESLGAPTASSTIYFMLTLEVNFPNRCVVFNPNVFRSSVELGIISSFCKLEKDKRTFELSLEEDTATVLM